MNYLCASVDLEYDFLMLQQYKPLFEMIDLVCEHDIDKILNEIKTMRSKTVMRL